MNKVYGMGGESPDDYDNQEMMECVLCIGTGEIFEPQNEEGTDGIMVECPCCVGEKLIPRVDGYTAELDYIDDEADNSREEED